MRQAGVLASSNYYLQLINGVMDLIDIFATRFKIDCYLARAAVPVQIRSFLPTLVKVLSSFAHRPFVRLHLTSLAKSSPVAFIKFTSYTAI